MEENQQMTMEKIQMVDLVSQYQRLKPMIDASMIEVIEKAQFINGPAVSEFKADLEKYLGVNHVVPCANGTDALQISLMALGLKPGDEVITPSFTYIATTEVMALLGLKPIFVDVDKDTFCIDATKIEGAITSKTKAIVPVHLYGQAADMNAIMEIANKHKLFVVEDNAQAIGCDFKLKDGSVVKTGTIGTIGCTSFFPSKNLGCYGDGGAMFTNDAELAAKLKMVSNHGQSKKYHHDIVGCNSRLDGVQAAVLKIKLKELDNFNAARNKVADHYDQFLGQFTQIQAPKRTKDSNHVFHQYTMIVEGYRDELHQFLADRDVPSMIYYPIPAHKQKMFESFGSAATVLPVTDWFTDRVLSLPIHTEMKDEHLNYICNTIKEFFDTKVK